VQAAGTAPGARTLPFASRAQHRLLQSDTDSKAGDFESLHLGGERWDVATKLRGQEQAQCADDTEADSPCETAGIEIIQDQHLGTAFLGEDDRFGLSGTEVGLQHIHGGSVLYLTYLEPVLDHEADRLGSGVAPGDDFLDDRSRTAHAAPSVAKQIEPIEVGEEDER